MQKNVEFGPECNIPVKSRKDDVGIKLYKLPDEKDKDYIPLAVKNVIAAFEVFQADGMSLDYCGITGAMRQRVLKNPLYRQRTRIARAKKYLQEIKEIEEITKQLDNARTEDEEAMPENRFNPREKDIDFKSLFGMKLKAAEMRRSLLNLSRENDNEGQTEGIDINFVPVTREEWLALDTTEFHAGFELGQFEEETLIGGVNISGAVKKAKELLGQAAEEEVSGGFKANADGSVEDF